MQFSAIRRAAGNFLAGSFAIVGVLLVALVLLARTDDNGVTRVADRPVLTVLSDSMTPTFKAGDIVIEESVAGRADDLAVGTVITFHAANGLVTHRIVAVEQLNGGTAYRTQGDANNMVDATLVEPADIVGAYSWRIPSAGYVLDAVQTPRGMTIAILLPVLLLLLPRFAAWWRAAGDEAEGDPNEAADDPSGAVSTNS